ncbi:LysM peptidoglycan-binding domain-containing protein [Niallia sp. XMNu-256]|uniref:LysM peptidoglycan-binding domain-containing protein n=1 Tax=Niallia sp. XMNu-256 TaxID=3082444 RepID=UPI0030D10C1F
MSKERPYREQAEKLRQKLEKTTFEEGQMVEREELPPRSRVHQQKREKNKWKLKYPVIRLLVLFFILLPITIFSIYSSLLKEPMSSVRKTIGESSEGFEVIDIEKSVPKEKSEKEINPEPEPETSTEGEQDVVEDSVDRRRDPNDLISSGENSNPSISVDSIVSETKSQSNQSIYHTVQPGETIYRISMKYYQSKAGIDTIKRANGLSSNEIKVGQVLTIPLSK